MTLKKDYKISLGSLLMALAILITAFGAHGLKNLNIDEKLIATYKTGGHYHLLHSLGIILLGILQQIFKDLDFKREFVLFIIGIIMFSGNCYLYTLTGIKIFAMLVPIGGVSFILGWSFLSFKIFRAIKTF